MTTALIFDLDDTLFPEVDYLFSAYSAIAEKAAPDRADEVAALLRDAWIRGDNAFDTLVAAMPSCPLTVARMVEIYRSHTPSIRLDGDVSAMLLQLSARHPLGIITDGRVGTQSAKIAALGLDRFFPTDRILISEATGADKLSPLPWQRMEALVAADRYVYVGDNPAKDFYQPRQRGWATVMVSDPAVTYIHPQLLPADTAKHPDVIIDSLKKLPKILENQK